ncbi:MAG: DUF2190 family protein [Magnetococcales bacterium]|nr:DUF2190 family protein [Magnetococcales bacterium]
MSRQSITLLTLTITASGAITACRGVGHDGAQATTQGQKIVGVACTDAADTEGLSVDVKGTAVIESGATIAVGDSLIVDASGRGIPVTGALEVASGATPVTSTAADGAVFTGADLPEFVFADALQAAAGAGEFIEVLLR